MALYNTGASDLLQELKALEEEKGAFARWIVANQGAMSVKEMADKMEAMNNRTDAIQAELKQYQIG